jgi:membrane protease subunit (stomatin/prohibitin family)
VERAIDKAGAMRAIGNMQMYTQYETANSINDAAKNPGGLAAAGVGVGLGFGMGGQVTGAMGGLFAGQAQPKSQPGIGGASPAPPTPLQLQLFVAVNGQQTGPFDLAALQQMARSGQLTRDSLVWKQGLADWTAAGQLAELAVLFGAVPPPVPPA